MVALKTDSHPRGNIGEGLLHPPGRETPGAGCSLPPARLLSCLAPSCVLLTLSFKNSSLPSVCQSPRDTPRTHCLYEGFFQAASSLASCCMTPFPHPWATALIFAAFVEKSTHSFAKLFSLTTCNVLGTSCSISGKWMNQMNQ